MRTSRLVFPAFLTLAVVAWAAMWMGANALMPGLVGASTGLFGGFLLATLIVAVGGWSALKLAQTTGIALAPPAPADLSPRLAPAWIEMDRARRDAVQRQLEGSALRAPLCASAALAVWTLAVNAGAPGSGWDYAAALLGGALVGHGWSVLSAARGYGERYRARVLPALAAAHGDFAFAQAQEADLMTARRIGLLPAGETVLGGQISGRGLKLSEVWVKAATDRDPTTHSGFDGVLVEAETDAAGAASLEDLLAARPSLRVAIEDVKMLPGFAGAQAGLANGHVVIAVNLPRERSLFEAGSFRRPRGARRRLERLDAVLAAVSAAASA